MDSVRGKDKAAGKYKTTVSCVAHRAKHRRMDPLQLPPSVLSPQSDRTAYFQFAIYRQAQLQKHGHEFTPHHSPLTIHSLIMKSLNRLSLLLPVLIVTLLGLSSTISAAHHEEPIIEVRVYKIAPGKMDEWERFFHDKLVEPQEKAGIKIIAAYRTLEDENLFVWMRQFSSKANMAAERDGFYKSEAWLNTLRVELKEKGLIEGVEMVYTVSPSK